MRQLMIVVLTVILACTGVSFAEEQAQCPGMTGHMRMMGSMMPMMHMTHTTAWDGMVYLLTPMKLEKLNSNLEVVASVEYDTIPCMMQQGEQEEATRPIPLGGETMTTVHGVHRRCMMSSMAVSADAQGVYVLRGMMMTVYDHDLNELRSKQVMTVPEDAGNCPMCRMMMQHMQQQGMMGRGMMMGGGMMRGPMTGHGTMMQGWSAPMERDLERGQVQMRYLPAQDMPGMVSFEVRVLDASMDEDEGDDL